MVKTSCCLEGLWVQVGWIKSTGKEPGNYQIVAMLKWLAVWHKGNNVSLEQIIEGDVAKHNFNHARHLNAGPGK